MLMKEFFVKMIEIALLSMLFCEAINGQNEFNITQETSTKQNVGLSTSESEVTYTYPFYSGQPEKEGSKNNYSDLSNGNNSLDDNYDIENESNTTSYDYYHGDDYYNGYGDEYMYPGYSFEKPVYLYIWEVLVILTFLVNIIVISILLRKKMRSATNMILVAIAIADTLTGLVTLPTYIMVFQKYDHYKAEEYYFDNQTKTSFTTSYPTTDDNSTDISHHYNYPEAHSISDGYVLTKELCRGFMISKFFLSKSFHTISIFLTLFLAIQRYVSVAFPFKSQSLFTVNKTIVCCIILFIASPVLHVYHLTSDKAVEGMCEWNLGEEDGCNVDCIFIWILFFIRHFIPCLSLTVFTVLFIKHLRLGTQKLRKMDRNASQLSKRTEENRRILIIVITIVIVFLIPEIPYGIFLLFSAIEKAVKTGGNNHLEINRAIHMTYELLLVLTFNANFYVYTFLNRKFRKCLYRAYIKPVQRKVGSTRMLSISRTSSTFTKATQKTDSGTSRGAMELKNMRISSSNKSVTIDTGLDRSQSQGFITKNTNSECNEHSALNPNDLSIEQT